MTPPPRALLLAVDGLDWRLLQSLVDAGRMPYVAQLMEAGAQGRLGASSTWLHGAAAWTSVATGQWPDGHGVCHDWVPHQDGLRLAAPDASAVVTRTLWQQVHESGGQAWCLAWPATQPPADAAMGKDAGPTRCATGFEESSGSSVDCWPLAPGSVQPQSLREPLHALRVHPHDLELDDIKAILPGGSHHPHGPLVQGARQLVARWASVQAAGVAWSAEPQWRLLALRLAGLPHWVQALRCFAPAVEPAQAEGLVYRWLDLLVGRYMAQLGRATAIALVSDGLAQDAGGVVLCGPGVPADALLAAPQLVDVAPTLSALLGLPHNEQADGRDLLARSASPAPRTAKPPCTPGGASARPTVEGDADAHDWLQAHGVSMPDLRAGRRRVKSVQAAALGIWAIARESRGRDQEAVVALQEALRLDPGQALLRLRLGRLLVLDGQADACEALLPGLPEALRQPPWDALWDGLIAFGRHEWARAFEKLSPLDSHPAIPLNVAAWLGWCRLLQGNAEAAHSLLQRAVAQNDAVAWSWEGLGCAHYRLGHLQDSVQAFSRAIALEPRHARLHLWRATVLEASGDHAAAQAGRWQALALDPQLQAAKHGLVRSCYRQLGLQQPPGSDIASYGIAAP